MKQFFTALLIAVIVTLSLSGSETQAASQWVNVTIDADQVPGDLNNYVAYIDMSDLPAAFWETTNCTDIRMFKSDGTTELAREIVSCTDNGSSGTGELHVKYTGTLSSTVDTVMQLHYDGTSADYAVGATYGRNAVWSDYAGVFHMEDNVDSSGNTDLTEVGTVTHAASQKIEDGVDWQNSLSNYYSLSDVLGGSSVTIQGWYNPDNTGTNQTVWHKAADDDDAPEWRLLQLGNGNFQWSFGAGNSWPINRQIAHGMTTGNWYHITQVYNGTAGILYRDGSSIDSETNSISLNNTNMPASMGIRLRSGSVADQSLATDAQQDEVRFRSGELSANWIATDYNNQNSPSTFYTVSGEQGGGGGEEEATTTPQSAYTGDTAITGEGAIR